MEIKLLQNPEEIIPEIKIRLEGKRLFLLTDSGVARHCLPILKPFLKGIPICTIPQGEANKTLQTCEIVWQFLMKHKADRQSVIIILGGGMPGDLGAFCASVFLRGIDFVLIPTTLLSMVDASIGGKTGIDFLGGKNLIGSFSNPKLIIAYPEFLDSLPENQLISGSAEVIKHWLISNQGQWQKYRKTDLNKWDWKTIIAESQDIKMGIVSSDPLEKSRRKSLNAGHTIGHGIESYYLSQNKPVAHGLAVAAGLLMESHISFSKGLLSGEELGQMEEYIFSNFGRLHLKMEVEKNIWDWILLDKKNRDGRVMMALVGPIGKCHLDVQVSRTEWKAALEYYVGR